MSNRSYNPSAVPVFAGPGSSKTIRDEFGRISNGFSEIEYEIDNLHLTPSLPGYVAIIYAVSGDTVRLVEGVGSLVIKTDPGPGEVTVLPPVGEYFANGLPAYFLSFQYEALVFANNGVNYYQVTGGTVVPVSASPTTIQLDIVSNPDVILNGLIPQYNIMRIDDGSTGGIASVQVPNFPTYSIDGEEYLYFSVGGEAVSLIQVDNGDSTFTWRSF